MILFLLVVAPIIELLVAIAVAGSIGWLPVLIWVVVALIVGWLVVKNVGLSAWRRVMRVLREGRVPANEAADAVVQLVAGVLIFLPGLLSDVVGLGLLLPPIRANVRERALNRWWPKRVHGATVVDVHEVPGGWEPDHRPRQIGPRADGFPHEIDE